MATSPLYGWVIQFHNGSSQKASFLYTVDEPGVTSEPPPTATLTSSQNGKQWFYGGAKPGQDSQEYYGTGKTVDSKSCKVFLYNIQFGNGTPSTSTPADQQSSATPPIPPAAQNNDSANQLAVLQQRLAALKQQDRDQEQKVQELSQKAMADANNALAGNYQNTGTGMASAQQLVTATQAAQRDMAQRRQQEAEIQNQINALQQ